MPTAELTAPTRMMFEFAGLTDSVTECELCGRNHLKRTVVLLPLDSEGGRDGEETYYGTSCAAMALGWSHGTDDPQHRRATARVLREARAAEAKRESERAVARERLTFWGPFEHAEGIVLWALWRARNPHSTDTDPREWVPQQVAADRATLGLDPYTPDVPVWAAAYLDWHDHNAAALAEAPGHDLFDGYRNRAADRARRALAEAGLCGGERA